MYPQGFSAEPLSAMAALNKSGKPVSRVGNISTCSQKNIPTRRLLAQDVIADRGATCALSENRDFGGIASEQFDVLLGPLQGQDLVFQPRVSRHYFVSGGQKPERADAVIEGHHNHILFEEEIGPVDVIGRRSVSEPAAVDEHHHRKFGFVVLNSFIAYI